MSRMVIRFLLLIVYEMKVVQKVSLDRVNWILVPETQYAWMIDLLKRGSALLFFKSLRGLMSHCCNQQFSIQFSIFMLFGGEFT